MKRSRSRRPTALADLVTLTYELLDAHSETAELVAGSREDLRWRVHLDYLRALQRQARELLARIPSEERSER
jgi:hypothetical protein